MSFSKLIWIGLCLGLGVGIFFGEICSSLKIIGDIYIGLLQMTVLPYIVVSLILNIGRMTTSEARILAGKGIRILLMLWGIGAVMVIAFGFSFPKFKTGSFFSTSMIESPTPVNILDLFIPSNLFYSLSGNLVPAVVLFCIFFGVALLGIKNKTVLLDQLDIVAEGLRKMNGYAVNLTPIGLFAITASAAGTLTIQEFGRLQAYLLTDTVASLILTVLVLPMLISACTPFRYRDILLTSKDALITAFITSSVFVVIPMLIESINKLYEAHAQQQSNLAGSPEFIVPLGYPFPDLGKVLSLLFIQFAAWFYSGNISLESYLFILPVGIVLCFGKLITAIPFLLEAQKIPLDIFQLFLMAGVYSSRVGDLLGCIHLLAFTILTTCAMRGWIKIQWRKISIMLITVSIACLVSIIGIREFIKYTSKSEGSMKERMLSQMQLMADPVQVNILKKTLPNPAPLKEGQSRLERIKQRKIIRIGFNPERLPFSYLNTDGKLLGFDVELMYHLAKDLNVGIEFIPYRGKFLEEHFQKDHFDIAVSAIVATANRSEQMLLSDPYLSVDMALVVKDYRKKEFKTIRRIKKLENPSLGVSENYKIETNVKKYFPDVQVIELKSEREFFENIDLNLDALMTSAQGGSAWTLLYPDYTVVRPPSVKKSVPLVIPTGTEDSKMEKYLESWISLKKLDGTIAELYDYWILGKSDRQKKPRWCIIRDVLHLID